MYTAFFFTVLKEPQVEKSPHILLTFILCIVVLPCCMPLYWLQTLCMLRVPSPTGGESWVSLHSLGSSTGACTAEQWRLPAARSSPWGPQPSQLSQTRIRQSYTPHLISIASQLTWEEVELPFQSHKT